MKRSTVACFIFFTNRTRAACLNHGCAAPCFHSYSPSPPRGYCRRGRSPSPRGRYGGRGSARDQPTSLLVGNLRYDCRPNDLRKPFEQFGPLKDMYLPKDYYTRVKEKRTKKIDTASEEIARLATTIKNSQIADEQTPGTEESQEGKIVFTEIAEFVWGMQLDKDAHKADAEDVFNYEDDAAVASHEEIEDKAGRWSEVNDETVKDEVTTVEDAEGVAPDEIIHEVPVGKGLSGALKLLHERGSLKESIDWGGRNMDKKKSKLVGIVDTNDEKDKEKNKDKDNDRFKDLRIERRDEFGRIMTPKEAFRKISHTFHGKAPGKRKQEKRMKQYQEEQKLKKMKNSDTPSLSVERMREAQAQLKTPYLVLSGHVRPGELILTKKLMAGKRVIQGVVLQRWKRSFQGD